MFDFDFVSETTLEYGEEAIHGQLTLGDFAEAFISPLTYWPVEDYKRHWFQAAKHLLVGNDRTVFFTTMYDPNNANFITAWPMWRFGEQLRIRNEIWFLEELTEPFDPDNPYIHIADFLESTHGEPISTWFVSMEDIEAFVQRLTSN